MSGWDSLLALLAFLACAIGVFQTGDFATKALLVGMMVVLRERL